MAERVSTFVDHSSGGALGVEDARVGLGALAWPGSSLVAAKTGFRPGPGSPGLVTATGTPDANVHVAPFQLFMESGRGAPGGLYICTLDSAKAINILSTPADPSNPRNDLIIAQQNDELYSDGTYTFEVIQVVGNPAGSPVDPAVTGSSDYVTLARVRVDAGATSIAGGKITDLRPAGLYTVAVGGILPVPSAAVRNALAGAYDGMTIWRTDMRWRETYDSTGHWRVQDGVRVANFSALSNITDPVDGQLAITTDKHSLWMYMSGSWQLLLGGAGNLQWGTVSITPVASTPTSVSVSWPALAGGNYGCLVTPNTTLIGDTVHGASYASLAANGADIYIYRDNTVTTSVSWAAFGY